MTSFGFIGTGNMGSALARAAAKAVGGEHLVLQNRTAEKAARLAAELGAAAVPSAREVLACDYVFLGVKPQMLAGLAAELAPLPAKMPVLISMAAGRSIEELQRLFPAAPVIRIMPNTPVSVGEGMTLYCLSEEVTPEMEREFLEILSQSGLLRKLPEGLMDAGMAVSGCGPAFAYLFLEALADGGVACGLPRETALTLAAQTLLGAAKLQRETGQHPGALKDAVCSPAGTTIAGVRRLEASAFRSAAFEAVLASHARAKGI